MERLTILEVYRQILKRGGDARELAKKGDLTPTERKEEEARAEAFYWAAMMLEQTAEVNPPLNEHGEPQQLRCTICGDEIYGRVQVHHHNEKCKKCGYEIIATQPHKC